MKFRIGIILALSALCVNLHSQTPFKKGLIISSDKFNLLYENVLNPISINKAFDSLKFEKGRVIIENDKIYIEPSQTGRSNLLMFEGIKVSEYPFRVEKITVKPQVNFRRLNHSQIGRLQDKKMLYVTWQVDYDVKLVIQSFRIRIFKQNAQILDFQNQSQYFEKDLLKEIVNMVKGDSLIISEVLCTFPNGNEIVAADYKTYLH